MPFLNRFVFFSFGLILGVVIIVFSLSTRKDSLSFNYFPNSRIKNHLIKNQVFFSEKAICKMDCYNLDTVYLDKYISNSNVDFKKSKIRGYTDKVYYLTPNLKNKNIQELSFLKFEINSDSIKLVDMFLNLSTPFNQASGHPSKTHCPMCY